MVMENQGTNGGCQPFVLSIKTRCQLCSKTSKSVICISDAICNILIKLCIMLILMAIIVKHIYFLTLFGSIKGISKMCLYFPPPLV